MQPSVRFSDSEVCEVYLAGSELWAAGWLTSSHSVSAEFTPLDTVCSELQGGEILSVQMTKDLLGHPSPMHLGPHSTHQAMFQT